jgi:hypothetical protein
MQSLREYFEVDAGQLEVDGGGRVVVAECRSKRSS